MSKNNREGYQPNSPKDYGHKPSKKRGYQPNSPKKKLKKPTNPETGIKKTKKQE